MSTKSTYTAIEPENNLFLFHKLLGCSREEPKKQLIGFILLIANRKATGVRLANIPIDLG